MSDKSDSTPHCLSCERTDNEVPLVSFIYKGESLWICPQHLPLLIHNPAQLAGKLPGIEKAIQPPDPH